METIEDTTVETKSQPEVKVEKKTVKKLDANKSVLIFFVALAVLFGVSIYASGQDTASTKTLQARPGFMHGRTNNKMYNNDAYGAPMAPQGRQHYRTR